MLELVVLLCLNFFISSADNYTVGTNAQVVCGLNRYNYWQKKPLGVGTTYAYLQRNAGKYDNINGKTLTIYNLSFEDTGYYRCNYYYGGKWYFGDEQLITVTGSPTVFILNKFYYPTIGQQFIIPCTISDSDRVQWNRVMSTGTTQIIDLALLKYTGGTPTTPSLTIAYIIPSDGGDYQCCGYNSYGGSCVKTTLIPGNQPALSRNQEIVNAKISTNIELGVTITSSSPAPLSVYWKKDSQYISGIRYNGGNTNVPSLTINNVIDTDDGTYRCVINNGVGTASVDINLFTWKKPSVSLSGKLNLAVGSLAVIQGVITSKPNVRNITWTKDTVPITFSENIKYQISGSLTNPELKIDNVQEADKGTYSCAAYNGFDTGTDTVVIYVGEKELKSADKVPVVIGTVLSVAVFLLILFTVLVVLMKRRRVKKRQESSYETNEMINAETHAYGKTDTHHEYCNSHIKQTPATNNDIALMEGDCLIERYNVSELTKRLNDAESLKARIRAEFMFLESNSVKIDIPTNDYEIVLNENQTGLPTKESKTLYMKQSRDDMFIFSSLPDDGYFEQFWSKIIDKRIENIIMIVQKNEKTTSFCPTQDDVFKVAMLEIEMRSAEKTNDNIFLLRFTLHNKKSRTKHHVKIFKTNWDDSDKYPSVESICSLLDKVKIVEGRPTLMTGSKGKSFSVCAAISLCLQSVRAIERDTTFSLLEYATLLKRIEDDFIKVFDDYEFCYKVMAQYLETVHTYSFIE